MASFAEIAARGAATSAAAVAPVVASVSHSTSAAASSGSGGASAAASSGAAAVTASQAAWNVFVDSVEHVIMRWSTMEIAVHARWGGPSSEDKRDRLIDDILYNCSSLWKRKQTLSWQSVDAFVDEVMSSDFNADIDDGTIPAVRFFCREMMPSCVCCAY